MNFTIKLTPNAKQVQRGSRVILVALIIFMLVLDESGWSQCHALVALSP
jgi:hypothetical protein